MIMNPSSPVLNVLYMCAKGTVWVHQFFTSPEKTRLPQSDSDILTLIRSNEGIAGGFFSVLPHNTVGQVYTSGVQKYTSRLEVLVLGVR